jgi:ISXO2 transposase-like protein
MSEQFRVLMVGAYRIIKSQIRHAVINHSREYSNGIVHTNTIEGFWALVKRAWYGQDHHYSRKYMPLYISEACYKDNRRNKKNVFDETIAVMVGT